MGNPGEPGELHAEWLESQDWEWQDRAACKDAPPEDKQTFTCPPINRNEHGTGADISLMARAAAEVAYKYCGTCPVRAECLAWAKGDKYFVGIAAGVAFSGGWKRNTRKLRMN